MSKKVNSVTASKFLDWYFQNEDLSSFGLQCMEWMKKFGKTDITSEQLFEQCGGLIPQCICEDWNEDWEFHEYYNSEEIEFINDLK